METHAVSPASYCSPPVPQQACIRIIAALVNVGTGTADSAQAELHVIPVLFGQGRRLFDHTDASQIELERTRVLEGDGVTHLRYRVIRR